MYQFYFLSIITNFLAGLVLVKAVIQENDSLAAIIRIEYFDRVGNRLALGVCSLIVGLLKLFTVTAGDFPLFGDFIPALTGILAGFAILFEFYKSRLEIETGLTRFVQAVLLSHKVTLGFAAIVAAILHFLFCKVLFL